MTGQASVAFATTIQPYRKINNHNNETKWRAKVINISQDLEPFKCDSILGWVLGRCMHVPG